MTTTAYALRCRLCEHVEDVGPAADCPRCDGPTDVVYDWKRIARTVSRRRVGLGPPSLWRYHDLLPAEVAQARTRVGWTPLVRAQRLSAALELNVWLKVEAENLTGSYKDRTAALAVAAAAALGLETVCCTSTGNLGDAIAAQARAHDLEPIALAPAGVAATGPHVLPIDGTFDDCRRIERELSSLFPWGFVGGNLHPYAVEGGKTVAFEIAEQLGWRVPAAVVCPVASGVLLAKIAQGFHELGIVRLTDGALPRLFGAEAASSAPVAAGWAEERPVAARAAPAYGDLAIGAARQTGGAIVAVDDDAADGYTDLLSSTARIDSDRSGGVALGALIEKVQTGEIRPGEDVVLVVTGANPVRAKAPSRRAVAPELDAVLAALGAS